MPLFVFASHYSIIAKTIASAKQQLFKYIFPARKPHTFNALRTSAGAFPLARLKLLSLFYAVFDILRHCKSGGKSSKNARKLVHGLAWTCHHDSSGFRCVRFSVY